MNQDAIKKAAEELAKVAEASKGITPLRAGIFDFARALAAAMEPQKHDANGSATDSLMREIAEQQRDEAVAMLRNVSFLSPELRQRRDAFLARIDGGGK